VDHSLVWALVGLALVIAEVLTGTFYLVMLGVAAFAAAGTAYMGYGIPTEAIVGALIAALGCYGVYLRRTSSARRGRR
jgi:membrane protein implicated in regulation of membrane protease activity